MVTPTRRPDEYAPFSMIDERARNYLLEDRANAGLLVTSGDTPGTLAQVRDLPSFVPPGTVMVLNTSGTFFSRFNGCRLPDGTAGTVHFAQMLEHTALHWRVIVPIGLHIGDVIRLPGEATLQLLRPFCPGGVQASWEDWGEVWIGRFEGKECFDHWHPNFGDPIRYPYDTIPWTLPDMQNAFSGRATSAMMNNGGRNLTPAVIDDLLAHGVQIATVEMRTGVGVDQNGDPFNEFVSLDLVNAAIINAAIARGALILPVGTGVIRALDWYYDRQLGLVRPGSEWCNNIITPATGTWLSAWVSGMHEPKSTHLAMGSAVMTEPVMRAAMLRAIELGMYFHEGGDTHLHIPAGLI